METDKELVKKIHEDKEMVINERVYAMLKFDHKTRLEIMGMVQEMESGKSTIGSKDWQYAERLLCERFTYKNSSIAKIKDHWEDFPEDYLTFMMYALQVVIYPFLKEKLTS